VWLPAGIVALYAYTVREEFDKVLFVLDQLPCMKISDKLGALLNVTVMLLVVFENELGMLAVDLVNPGVVAT
jgi:hypothetical protein